MCGIIKNTINKSPFINGLLHRDIRETQKNCNKGNFLPSCSKGTYYLGRTVRFIVSVPISIVDIALQILQCLTMSAEFLCIKLEQKIRKIPEADKTFMYVVSQYALTAFFGKLES